MKTEWMDCPHSDHPHPLCDWPSTHCLQFDHQCNIMVYSNQHLLKFMGIHHGHMSKDFDLEKDCFHPEFFLFFCFTASRIEHILPFGEKIDSPPQAWDSQLLINYTSILRSILESAGGQHYTLSQMRLSQATKTLILICSVLPKTQHKVPSRKD